MFGLVGAPQLAFCWINDLRRFVLIALPYFWLLALFLVPFVIVFKIALSDAALAAGGRHEADGLQVAGAVLGDPGAAI